MPPHVPAPQRPLAPTVATRVPPDAVGNTHQTPPPRLEILRRPMAPAAVAAAATGCPGIPVPDSWDIAKVFEPNGEVYERRDMSASSIGTPRVRVCVVSIYVCTYPVCVCEFPLIKGLCALSGVFSSVCVDQVVCWLAEHDTDRRRARVRVIRPTPNALGVKRCADSCRAVSTPGPRWTSTRPTRAT